MKSLFKILAETNRESEKYFQNTLFYAKEMKKSLQNIFPDVRILIFGSAINGNRKPGSDIDILVISSKIPEGLFEQSAIKIKIKSQFPDAPFEIHLATPHDYENWYKNFIKNGFKKV